MRILVPVAFGAFATRRMPESSYRTLPRAVVPSLAVVGQAVGAEELVAAGQGHVAIKSRVAAFHAGHLVACDVRRQFRTLRGRQFRRGLRFAAGRGPVFREAPDASAGTTPAPPVAVDGATGDAGLPVGSRPPDTAARHRGMGFGNAGNRVLNRTLAPVGLACHRRPRRAGRPRSAAAGATGRRRRRTRPSGGGNGRYLPEALHPGNAIAISRHGPIQEQPMANERIERSDAEWQQRLSPEQYAVCRCSATEPPFTGRWWNHKQAGRYRCSRLRRAPVRVRRQVRFGHRLAPATPALRARDRSANTPTTATACTASKCVARAAIAPRARVPGRPGADRPALLHQSAALDFEAGDAG